jgi:membrane-associated phospholipid phosphatase
VANVTDERVGSGHRRALLAAALAAGASCVIAILTVDGPLAVALRSLAPEARRGIQGLVGVCELLFAFGISPYLYGGLLVAAGVVAFRATKSRLVPWALLFVGLSHVTARFVTDILKPPFSRLRPFEALGSDGWHDTWFAAVGNSFPSGHAAHFWSLFFPLAVLFPRWRAPLVVLPVLVSAARVAVNDHYLSDVLASAAIAALITWAYAIAVLERGRG